MNTMTPQQFCGCRVREDGHWMEPCGQHLPQYTELTRIVLARYEAFRRQVEVPAPREAAL